MLPLPLGQMGKSVGTVAEPLLQVALQAIKVSGLHGVLVDFKGGLTASNAVAYSLCFGYCGLLASLWMCRRLSPARCTTQSPKEDSRIAAAKLLAGLLTLPGELLASLGSLVDSARVEINSAARLDASAGVRDLCGQFAACL